MGQGVTIPMIVRQASAILNAAHSIPENNEHRSHSLYLDIKQFLALSDCPGAAHIRPILEAVLWGDVTWIPLLPYSRAPMDAPSSRCITSINDDPVDGDAVGPQKFSDLSSILSAAKAVAVMSGTPVPAMYSHAAKLAESGSCAVLIETRPCRHDQWLELVRRHMPPSGKLFDLRPRMGGK